MPRRQVRGRFHAGKEQEPHLETVSFETMRLSFHLSQGARIGVFAPSGRFDPDRLEKGIALVESWGFVVVRGPGLHAGHRYLAGTDHERLEATTWALTDPDLDACWMARGGYGLTPLLDRIPWEEVLPRPVIGFSDGTALLVALQGTLGLPSIHGPVLHSVADGTDEASQAHLKAILQGEGVGPLAGELLLEGRETTATGPLVGGNLCILTALCGTRWQLNAQGCILLLEDVAEPPYRVDRMLQHLHMAGVFDGVVGVAIGELQGASPPEDADWTLGDLLRDQLSPLGVPVVTGLAVGHGDTNLAFVHGAPAELHPGGLTQDRAGFAPRG
jgi:muramoyltetrapeptide carboxypeptidase